MKRRQFIQSGSLMTLPIMLGGLEVTAVTRSSLFSMVNDNSDRVLVLIQLNGGNDGLNMVIPIDQYQGLNEVRPNLILPESSVLKLNEATGIHAAMTGVQEMYKDGRLAVIQSVGYPNQNRSHFRSTDIWTTASDSDEFLTTGWLGRYLDLKYPGYPIGYPNEEHKDPFAITLGTVVSETCQGPQTNFSYTLVNKDNIRLVEETIASPSDGSCYSEELDFIRVSIKQSNAYATQVLKAFDTGNNVSGYPNSNLANQLKVVANLISGGLKTKIYVVSIGGFDTHANQVMIGDTINGTHADLLKTVSDAVKAFCDDLKNLGIEERVVGMTFSEFGRQIRANNSFGTDHGTAAPLFVFGSCVQPGIFGENPQIDPNVQPQEGVPMQYDFRSVYASILVDWLGVKESDIRQVLFDDFQKIPFLKDCSDSTSLNELASKDFFATIYPNPVQDYAILSWKSGGGYQHVSLFDMLGSRLQVLVSKHLESGNHELMIPMGEYPAGSYFVRIAEGPAAKTIKIIKQ